ncbi:MAG TPA: hypothetical protein VNY08_07185 [Bradyrhizobium sp.]|jgi:hypothetical protein|nr:hypothetical protein [Bradyrhizobium sp.]
MKCLRIYATPDGESRFGEVEIPASDGERRHVGAGSFVLIEDTEGKGHISRHSPQAQTVLWISLPNRLDLP